MNGPLVSIGLPSYNRRDGLRKALDCFTQQTYKNLEIIVSDNCSPEDPTEMVRKYEAKDARIKYFRQEKNIGMTLNGHFVWEKAAGKYFILGSDDDWWDPEFISVLVAALQNEPGAVCAFCDFEEVDMEGKKIVSLSRYARARKLLGMKIHSYPDHYPLLKEFTSGDIVTRLKNFIQQKEYDGKANVHRAICDRQVFLDSISALYLNGLAECWAFDQLLAFTILTRGPLALSERTLFKCTVGNQKHYVDPRSRIVYLEGYIKIIDSVLNGPAAAGLKAAVDRRYLDNTVGFFQEYFSILKEFTVKASAADDAASLTLMREIRDLVSAGENSKAASLAKGFSSKEAMAEPSGFSDTVHGLPPAKAKRVRSAVAREILDSVRPRP